MTFINKVSVVLLECDPRSAAIMTSEKFFFVSKSRGPVFLISPDTGSMVKLFKGSPPTMEYLISELLPESLSVA